MIVKIVKTGKTETYNDGFATRLIEQGRAVRCEPPREPEPFMNKPEPETEAETPQHEEPKKPRTGKNRKG